MAQFDNFDSLFAEIKKNPKLKVQKSALKEIFSEMGDLTAAEKMILMADRRYHSTLFFEELIRNCKFSLEELKTISATSAPGAVAVIKNINHYADHFSTVEKFEVLRALLKPLPRASKSTALLRSKKEIVSALCTREGLFVFARELDPMMKSDYQAAYGETLEETIVKYIESVYAQELVLSVNDKEIVLPRVANSLRRAGANSPEADKLESFIHNRFYHRIFTA